jgi:hypothetical protein
MDFPKKVLRNFPAEVAENAGELNRSTLRESTCACLGRCMTRWLINLAEPLSVFHLVVTHRSVREV